MKVLCSPTNVIRQLRNDNPPHTQCFSKTVAQVTSEMQELTTTDLTGHTDELLYSDVVYLNTVGDDTTSHKNATTT